MADASFDGTGSDFGVGILAALGIVTVTADDGNDGDFFGESWQELRSC